MKSQFISLQTTRTIFGFIVFICFIGNFNSYANTVDPERKEKKEIKKPNLLFIMTDQQRFDAMSCAGNGVIKTPNMDRLAREGVMFTNAYVANPVCVPSRSCFLTGLSPVNIHVEANGDYTSNDIPNVPTFDMILKENGYQAEYYGKWHAPLQFTACYDNGVKVTGGHNPNHESLINAYQDWLVTKGVMPKKPGEGQLYSTRNRRPYTPIALDFNHDDVKLSTNEKLKMKVKQVSQYGKIDLPERVSYAAYTAEETLNALERLKDTPFTLTCSFDPPHPPMVVQEPYYSMYSPEAIPLPESINDSMEHSPYKQRSDQKDQLHYRDGEQIKNMRSIYYGMVKEVDDWIGEILAKLDNLGLTENTIVVFTSDHGEMLGDHGMHSKMIFYEGSVHVPLLMRFPKMIKKGTVVKEPVSALDVFPTILDYMGISIPKSDGISLKPFILNNPVDRAVVSYSTGRTAPNYMIRYNNLKLMMGESNKNTGINGLYDLDADPHEMRNLLKAPIDVALNKKQAINMKNLLVQWMQEHEPDKALGMEKRELY